MVNITPVEPFGNSQRWKLKMTDKSNKPTDLSHAALDGLLGSNKKPPKMSEVGSNVNKTRILPSLITHEVIAGMTSLKGLWLASHKSENGKFDTHPLKLFPIVIAKGLKKSDTPTTSILMESEYLQENDDYDDAADGDEDPMAFAPPADEDGDSEDDTYSDASDGDKEPTALAPPAEDESEDDVVRSLVDTEINGSASSQDVSVDAGMSLGTDIAPELPTDLGVITYDEGGSDDETIEDGGGQSDWKTQLNNTLVGFGLAQDNDLGDDSEVGNDDSSTGNAINSQNLTTGTVEVDDGAANAAAIERAIARSKLVDGNTPVAQPSTKNNQKSNSINTVAPKGSASDRTYGNQMSSTFPDAISHLSLSSFTNQRQIASFIDNINTLMSSMSDWGAVRAKKVGEVGAGPLAKGVSSKEVIGSLIVPIVNTIYQQASKMQESDTKKRFKNAIQETLSNPQMDSRIFGQSTKNQKVGTSDVSSLNKYKQLCVSILTIVLQLAGVKEQSQLSNLQKPEEKDYIGIRGGFKKALTDYNRQVMCRDILDSMWFSKHAIHVISDLKEGETRHTDKSLYLDSSGIVIGPEEADRYKLGVNLEEGATEGFFIAINIALPGEGVVVKHLVNGSKTAYTVAGMGITAKASSYGAYFGDADPDKQNKLYVQKVLINFMSNSSNSPAVVSDLMMEIGRAHV